MPNQELTVYLQDGLLKLLIEDTEFLKIGRSILPSEILPNEMARTICRACYKFLDEFGSAPKADFQDYFFTTVNVPDKELYVRFLAKINEAHINKQYIISKVSDYVQLQTFQQLLLRGSEQLKQGRVTEFKNDFLKACKLKISGDEIGHNFWDYIPRRAEEQFLCPTEIDALDGIIQGYKRSELFLWVAPSNCGKSWFLVHGAKTALTHGLNVVYYTLEMSAENTQARIAMSLAGLRRDESSEGKQKVLTYFDGTQLDITERKSILSDTQTLTCAKDFWKHKGGNLFVVPFIDSRCTVGHIENHLMQMEIRQGIVPDIIFIDYADKLVADRKFDKEQDAIDHVFKDLRSLCLTRNIGGVTASQANREGFDARRVNLKHISKSIGKIQEPDIVATLSRTDAEYRDNTLRIYLAKTREGERSVEIEVKQLFDIGGVCLESRIKDSDGHTV